MWSYIYFLAYPRLLPVAISLRIFQGIKWTFPALPFFECVFACLWNLVWHVTSFGQWSVRRGNWSFFFFSFPFPFTLIVGWGSGSSILSLGDNDERAPCWPSLEMKQKQNLVLQIWHFGIVGNYNLPKLSCLSQYLFRFWVILYI